MNQLQLDLSREFRPLPVTEFNKNFAFTAKFSQQLKAILGQQFIVEDIDEDQKRGTDFLVFSIKPFRVGVRLRRWYVYSNERYRNQFTIRWKLENGYPTEIDKIRDGFPDYILYGFCDEPEEKIVSYFIGDLEIFRKANLSPVETHWNYDGHSQLAAFCLDDMPSGFIIKQWNSVDIHI